MIKLGVQAKDKVTGFEGIVTGAAQYLSGCNQFVIQPPMKDGKFEGSHWFDEGRLEVTGPGVSPASVQAATAGGPQADCPN